MVDGAPCACCASCAAATAPAAASPTANPMVADLKLLFIIMSFCKAISCGSKQSLPLKTCKQVIKGGYYGSGQTTEQQGPNAAFKKGLRRLRVCLGEEADKSMGGT